jgi:hypothetical protein
MLPLDLVRRKARVRLRTKRDLKLIRLAGMGLARLGATAEVVHGGLPYTISQSWAKALHDLSIRPDGIAYNARHDDEALCYALFDTTPICVEEEAWFTDIDQDWFWEMAEMYGVGIAPDSP